MIASLVAHFQYGTPMSLTLAVEVDPPTGGNMYIECRGQQASDI